MATVGIAPLQAPHDLPLTAVRLLQHVPDLPSAGILIEDQVAPKSCGHVRGKRVVSREEAVSRIRAAADARCATWR